jgi:hypothetical protein
MIDFLNVYVKPALAGNALDADEITHKTDKYLFDLIRGCTGPTIERTI